MPKTWQAVRYFHIDGYGNIGSSSYHWAYCDVMGGKLLERGEKIRLANGDVGYKLKEKRDG